MKSLSLIAAALALPVGIASAQTPPATTTSSSQIPYIPLFSSGGNAATGTSGTGTSSLTWYIDTARNLVVLCFEAAAGSTSTSAPSFTCTAQAVPTAASTGASGAGATGSGSSTGGAAGANPMGG